MSNLTAAKAALSQLKIENRSMCAMIDELEGVVNTPMSDDALFNAIDDVFKKFGIDVA